MRRLWGALTAAVVGAAMLAAPAPAREIDRPEAPDRAVSSGLLPASPAAVRAFWTPAKMRAAAPRDIVELPGAPAPRTAGEIDQERGEPGGVGPVGAGGAPLDDRGRLGRSSGTSAAGATVPYTKYEVADPKVEPLRTHGRIFFEDPMTGGTASCSGTAVNSANKSVVWTAGHCVSMYGAFMVNLVFVPAYDGTQVTLAGQAPFGVWPARELITTTGWHEQMSNRFDMAAAVVAHGPSGALLVDVVGGRGIAWNAANPQSLSALGYPARPAPYDGRKMRGCDSTTAVVDTKPPGTGPNPIGMGCDMQSGSSGGGWVNGAGMLNGNVSYGYPTIDPEIFYSPYFGSAAQNLYTTAAGTATGPQPPSVDISSMKLSLKLIKRNGKLIAKGRMTTGGDKRCRKGAPVALLRKARGQFNFVRATATNDFGYWKIRKKFRKGRYVAYGPYGFVDDTTACTEAVSPLRRIF